MYDIVPWRGKSNENPIDNREACRQLYQAGFTGTEIYWLLHLREKYVAEQAKQQESVILRRLEFVRWLVRTGRLTEQTVREAEPAEERGVSPQPV